MPRITLTPLTLIAVVFSLTLTLSPAAHAGIADSPLPVLQAGATTLHLYSVLGIMDPGGTAAMFSCTSTDTAPMQVGVELFGGLGGAPANDAVASSLTVAPGATVIFGTSNTPYISPNSLLGSPGSRGSARILSTSKKLACSAFIVDASNVFPNSMMGLTIIAKTKQKAAN